MFMGSYEHSLDAKGRIIIPAKFREELGETFVVTLGLDGCLFVYPTADFEKFANNLATLPGTKDARELQRHFMANAKTVESDKQGRASLPSDLRNKVGLTKDAVFIGVMSKIEIWSKDRWDSADDVDNVDDIADKMAEYGLSF